MLPVWAAASVLLAPAPAEEPAETPHLGWALAEITAVTAGGTIWYWANTDLNDDDWELHWDLPSWRRKMTPDGIRFDTNAFYINARNHPTAGVVNYGIGRANGFGVFGSTLLNVGASAAWEYLVEFKEIVSLNDLIVNSSSGLSIGEPLFALARELRGRSPAAFRRAGVGIGRREARFAHDVARTEVEVGADVDLVRTIGYATPGRRTAPIRAGALDRLEARLLFGDEGPEPVVGAYVGTRTSLWGRLHQEIDDDGVGYGALGAIVTAFTYDTRRLPGGEHDRLAATHLVGALVELAGYTRELTLRWETSAYLDFALVDAHAFEAPPEEPGTIRTSSMTAQGYYFGWGATAESRLRVDFHEWTASALVQAHGYGSIDSMDRVEDPRNVHGLTDQRVRGRLGLALRPGIDHVALTAAIEGIARRGTQGDDVERHTFELGGTLGVEVGF